MTKWRCEVCGNLRYLQFWVDGGLFFECVDCGLVVLRKSLKKEKMYEFSSLRRHLEEVSPVSRLIYKVGGGWFFTMYNFLVFKIRSAVVEKHVDRGRILDIGTADGYFLTLFDQVRWKVWGVEINKNLPKLVPNISCKKIEDYKSREKFDVITLWHVWEHFGKIKTQIAKIKSLLEPDGVVIIEVPSADSIWRKVFGENWVLWMVPQHTRFWTKASLETFLRNNGFKIIKTEYVGYVGSGLGSGVRRWGVGWAVLLAPILVGVNLFAGQKRDNLRIIASGKIG